MNISQKGIDLIKKFEGCRLKAYKPVPTEKYWTIGFGRYSPSIKEGQKITQAEAEQYLKEDLKKYSDAVNACVTVAITQHQHDALTSFAYNCGIGALQKSTLLKKVNAKDFTGAADEFGEWTRGGGNVLQGLVKRRSAEKALFLLPVPNPHPYPGHPVKEGSTNTKSVKEVQKKVGVTADGVFGPKTTIAVKTFQTKHKLTADGIVGETTWNVMF